MGSEESEAGICLENHCPVESSFVSERSLISETNNGARAGFLWGAQAAEMGWQSPGAHELRAGGALGWHTGPRSSILPRGKAGAELPKPEGCKPWGALCAPTLLPPAQEGLHGNHSCSPLAAMPQKDELLQQTEVSLTEGYTPIQTIQELKVNIFTSYSTTQRELTEIL